MTLTRKIVRHFSPVYVSTKQNADIMIYAIVFKLPCGRTDAHKDTHIANNDSCVAQRARVHDNCMTI